VERGLVHSSVMLDGWHDVPLARRIAARVGVPCRVDNDVNTAAIAEAHVRGGARAMVFVAVGTGIGGALVLDGRLWRGASGVAGEIGNMTIARDGRRCRCGRRGCLNTVASGSAIERALGLRPNALARGAGSRARVRRAARIAAEALGVGLGNVMNLLNPSLVVIGGGVAFLGAGFLETLRRRARAEAFSEATRACRLERTRAGYEAGAIGAALLALSYLDGCPR
jgi:glucokinase